MKIRFPRTWGLLLASMSTTLAFAQVNGGFETGDLTGWTGVGDVSVQTSAMGVNPAGGTYHAHLASATDDVAPVSAGSGVNGINLLAGLGMQAGSLPADHGTALLGSGISQAVAFQKGDKVSFAWNFMTNQVYASGSKDFSYAPDPDNPDYAFFALTTGGVTTFVMLDDVFDGYVVDPNAPDGFLTAFTITNLPNQFVSETGYRTFEMTASSAFSGSVAFGVVHSALNGGDNGINSALLVDEFKIASVPEPISLVGLAGLAAVVARRKRK